jgi:hypothetical protein
VRVIILHDHVNPDQEVLVDGDNVQAVAPFGFGSSVQLASGAVVGVHESPDDVRKLLVD